MVDKSIFEVHYAKNINYMDGKPPIHILVEKKWCRETTEESDEEFTRQADKVTVWGEHDYYNRSCCVEYDILEEDEKFLYCRLTQEEMENWNMKG